MSKRISMKDAKRKYQHDRRMRRMQKEGRPLPRSLRGRKASYVRDKQDGIVDRMKKRIKANRGVMPEHLLEKEDNNSSSIVLEE